MVLHSQSTTKSPSHLQGFATRLCLWLVFARGQEPCKSALLDFQQAIFQPGVIAKSNCKLLQKASPGVLLLEHIDVVRVAIAVGLQPPFGGTQHQQSGYPLRSSRASMCCTTRRGMSGFLACTARSSSFKTLLLISDSVRSLNTCYHVAFPQGHSLPS